MILHKNKRFWVGAIVSSILFTSLMVYRVAFYSGTFKNVKSKIDWSSKPLKSDESWMNIVQNFKKIGFSYRSLENMDDGYRIDEETVMRINTMGMVQEIHVESKSTTDMDFAVKTFDFNIASGTFNFSVIGEIKGNTMYVKSSDRLIRSDDSAKQSNQAAYTSTDKRSKPIEIPLENRPYLTSGIIQATLASGLQKDQEMVLFIFDPSTLGQSPATVRMEALEEIIMDDKKVAAQKVSLSFKGVKQFAWVNDKGQVIKEAGLLGVTLVKTDKRGALEGASLEESDDLTQLASVRANKIIDNPAILTNLTVKISGIDENSGGKNLPVFMQKESANGSRQRFRYGQSTKDVKYGILTVQKESLEGLPQKLDPDIIAQIDSRFRQSDAFVQSADYKIRSFALKAITPSDYSDLSDSSTPTISRDSSHYTPLEKVEKLVAWIQVNIKRQPVISLPNAISTLENRTGDCNEHAALLAAFCRAVGIPAKIETGLVYLNGSFYYHAWNSVFVGRWITVDALFNQIPADVTHIAFSSGNHDMQLDILGLIGRVKIEILD